jgi:xanthine dehydrogenase accessory factor
MKDIFLEVHRILENGQDGVIARIIRHKGSAPRGTGTRCLVLEDGSIVGTIGGGRMEHRVIQKAKAVLQQPETVILKLALYGKDVAETEMLCGGAVDIYLEPVSARDPDTRELFSRLGQMQQDGSRGVLVTRIAAGTADKGAACRFLVQEGGKIVGRTGDLEAAFLQNFLSVHGPEIVETPRGLFFIEPVLPPEVLYLFGAGHISSFVCPMADFAGYRVVIIDDRKEFANSERFPAAAEIRVDAFSSAVAAIPVTEDSYIAIITRGHIHDQTILREALKTRAKYIGMIGSRRKRATIYAALEKEGIPREALSRVHCPIGLQINAQTPEEIAVSIVAELISVRNAGRKTAEKPATSEDAVLK